MWLYSGVLFTKGSPSGEDDEDNTLVRAYLLGQTLMDSLFKDTVLDAVVNKLLTSGVFDIRLTMLIYERTPESAPIRRL